MHANWQEKLAYSCCGTSVAATDLSDRFAPGGPALFSMMATSGGLLVGSGATSSRNEFVAEANEYQDEVETSYVFAVPVPAASVQ